MKRLYALLSAIMMAAAITLPSHAVTKGPSAAAVQDTLILKLRNQSKVLVVVKDLQDTKSLKEQSLDSLIVLLEKHVDQIERAGQSADENPVTITIEKKENPTSEDVNITITQSNGDKKQIISKEIKNVRVDVNVEKEKDKTTIGVNMQKDTTMADQKEEEKKNKDKYRRSSFDFQLDYGADRWVNTSDLDGGSSIEFRPIASRYLSLNSKWHYRLGGKMSPARLSTGFSFEFHNYMFDDNQYLENTGNNAVVMTSASELEKSKLATTSLTIPLELSFDVKNSQRETAFRIGGGGFVGYMLGSKTKVKFTDNGDNTTVKFKDDFHLNDFQYGLSGFIGIRSFDIFAKYNLNDVFESGKGPAGNALAVGIRWNM